ncbi:MAG: FHA domain [Rhodobacteraceae bacterium HLUCCA12]|nr:MAG: FHA domain [Rhodobacteraceae bacterium HLUCCA12]
MSKPTEYVRECPRCGHYNPEHRDTCVRDGEFLGLEPAIPAPRQAGDVPRAPGSPHTLDPAALYPRESGTAPEREDAAPATLILEALGFGMTFTVRSGATVGRAGPDSNAEVQLAGLPALNYVHGRHCRFELHDGRWHCVALDEGSFSPPNPTCVNGERVPTGEARPVGDGDRVSMANTHLVVRIP